MNKLDYEPARQDRRTLLKRLPPGTVTLTVIALYAALYLMIWMDR